MEPYPLEQPFHEQHPQLARLRDEAVEDLGFLSVNVVALGLVGLPEREPYNFSGVERAQPGSTQHGLGAVGIHRMVEVARPLHAAVAEGPDNAALGYAQRQAA